MLERRTNQNMLTLVQPKDGSRGDKPGATDKEGNGSAAANETTDDDLEEKVHERHTPVPKPVSTPPAVERMSPSAGPGLGKLTYNPITHAPSMC